ncbi:MAG: ATPase, T2SS/T4P/T4SS family [Lachnospiraceae bacterium]
MIGNTLLILLILSSLGIGIYRFMQESAKIEDQQETVGNTLEEYCVQIAGIFNEILKTNVKELNLNKEDSEHYEQNKKYLRNALRNCCYGNDSAKQYVKEYMKDLLLRRFKISLDQMESIIPFHKTELMTSQDKFEVLLYYYKKAYGRRGLERFIIENHLFIPKQKEKGECYEITGFDIERIYRQHEKALEELDTDDYLSIIVQRIYQAYRGHGVIDEIRDMNIDGVSGGVSGENAYESVWIFFQGKTMALPFLSFGTQQELERVCKNIYRYGSPGQLSAAKGYIVNEMADGSRVIVTRPPFAESWAFFIRKFDSVRKAQVEELITDEGMELPIQTMKWMIKGCQVAGITGAQGSGKTTLLMSLVQYIHPTFNLRIQELTFELNLRKLYPERNILSFRETSQVSGQEGLDLQKKTDGTVNILGEVATAPVAAWLVQIAQVASLFTLFTHHAKTTEDLVRALRNALLQTGAFSNERVAEEQVADVIRFDIHMNKDMNGHRYIERITEIIQDTKKETVFHTVDIIRYQNGQYQYLHPISRKVQEEIKVYLTESEREEFEKYNQMAISVL